jgi:hypothetical protein
MDRILGWALVTRQHVWQMELSNQSYTQVYLAMAPSNHHLLVKHFVIVYKLEITIGPLLLLTYQIIVCSPRPS